MKYFRFLLLFITMIVVGLAQAQTICVYKNGVVIQECKISEVDSVVYKVPEPSNNVLIGEIRLGAPLADGVDASDVANILTDELIQKNIDEGFLFEKDYKDVLSVVRSSNTNNGCLDIDSFSSFNFYYTKARTKLDWNGNKGFYNYHTVLVPSELSDQYIGAWGDDITMSGAGFDYVYTTSFKNVVNKDINFNGKNYKMYAYYVNKLENNLQFCLTVIQK